MSSFMQAPRRAARHRTSAAHRFSAHSMRFRMDHPPRRRVREFHMGKDEEERRANEQRREKAARIIAEKQKRKKLKQTDELLLDREALRQAAIRAGLVKPKDD
ncbi:MAG TPA: hypothetical protein VGC55_16320 [Dokdonella sp.]